jgi:hypothetical protein
MFADLHHLHQFMSLDQGGHIAAVSITGGTIPGDTSIFFGKSVFSGSALSGAL